MKRGVQQLVHGYQKGHALLASSCALPKAALELVTEQSDLSGPLPAGAAIPPHLTAYPVADTDFYALGRTWQDTEAPRSGCVLTHTVLIPMDIWAAATNPADFLELHQRPRRESLDAFKRELQLPKNVSAPAELAWLQPADAEEFTGKVFCEGLRSVIWFDCESPDLLVMALASFLWPALRGALYAHTFSLHAHAKIKNDLQLHFAPRAALSHFSRVPKQCHMSSRNDSEQEWIGEISDDLRAGRPRNSYLDGLKQYGHLLGRDPAAVRNLFALRELTGRMSHTPTAAIGILDIIDSLEPAAERAVEEKKSALNAALAAALHADPAATLRCLSLIDARLHRPSFAAAGGQLQPKLQSTVESMVASDPHALMASCGQNTPAEDSYFWQGVAAGMQTAAEARPDSLASLADCPAIASFVVRQSPRVASAYLNSSQATREESVTHIVDWISHIEREAQRQRLRQELLPQVVDDETAPLLEELLRDITSSEVGESLSVLAQCTQGFAKPALRRVVTDFIGQRFPDETIQWGQGSDFVQSRYVAEVVAESFPLSQEGLDLILATNWLTVEDHCEVWAAYVERSARKQLPQWFIRRASEDVAVIEPIARSHVLSARARHALQMIGEQCDYLPLARSNFVRAFIDRVADSELASLFIPKACGSALVEHVGGQIDGDRMLAVLSLAPCVAWSQQVPGDHVRDLFNDISDRDAWQRTWNTLSILPSPLFCKVAGCQVLDDLLRSFKASWSDGVAQAWAGCLRRAGELSYDVGLRLHMQATSFCLHNPRLPLGPVLYQAFPPVYQTVATGNAKQITDEMFGYYDWDKAKKLRKDVIDAYVASSWPAEELASIAVRCQILRKVVHRLQRKWGGDDYLRRMLEGLQASEAPEAASIRAEISAMINDPDFFEAWD
jgi:hypothetical protein